MSQAQTLLASLTLSGAMGAQAAKLLTAIEQARTLGDMLRAADRAEGFTLGLETLKALNPDSLERLYLAYEQAHQARQAALGG